MVKAMLLLSLDALEYGNLQNVGFEVIDLRKQKGLLIDGPNNSPIEPSITKQFFPTELSEPHVKISRTEELARRIVFTRLNMRFLTTYIKSFCSEPNWAL